MNFTKNEFRVALLCMVIFTIPFQEVYLFDNPYFFLPILAFIFYFLFSVITTPNLFRIGLSKRFLWPIFLLWLLLIVLSLINYEPRYMPKAYSYLQRLVTQMIFFVMLINEFKVYKTKVKTLFLAYVYSLVIASFCYLLGIGVKYFDGRLFLFNTNPNTLGIWFVIGTIIAFHLIFEHRISFAHKLFLLFCIVVFAFVMASTGSRATLVTLGVGLVLYSIFLFKSIKSVLFYLAPAILFGGFLLNILLSSEVLQERIETENERQDFGGRLPLWEATYDIVTSNPVFGVGPPKYEFEIVKRMGIYRVPHNEYFLILCYSGVIGFILFAIFLVNFSLLVFRVVGKRNFSRGLPLSLLFVVTLYMGSAGRFFTTFVAFFVLAVVVHYTTPSQYKISRNRFRRTFVVSDEHIVFD